MEGSVGVAPAAADATGEVQAPAEQTAPVTDPNLAPEATDPDSPEARLKAAEDRAKAAEDQLAQTQQEGPEDLLSALEGEDVGLDPEELAAEFGDNSGQVDPAQEDAQVKAFEQYIEGLVEKRVSPIEEQRTTEQIQAWQKEHSDVTPGSPIFKEIVATMEKVANQYGEQAAKDVSLLNLAYTAGKAKLADAGATPAEAAATQGASIETQAGQTQTGEPSEEQDYKEKMLGGNPRDGAGFR